MCTTGMLADALQRVVGEEGQVEALMGPGVDPHLYKATQGDLRALRKADLIFYNGLHLEGKLGEILDRFGEEKPVYALGESLDSAVLLNTSGYAGAYDPHIWFDLQLWSEVVGAAVEKLSEHRPEEAAVFQKRARTFRDSLTAMDAWVREEIQGIPEAQRVMITAHDAFGYFGRAYGIEVRGLQGISTVSEFGLKDVTSLVDFITGRGVKAIFVESSVPEKSLRAVVEGCARRGHEVRIGGTLYSDAMGEAGTPEGTYPGMVRHNVKTIVDALK